MQQDEPPGVLLQDGPPEEGLVAEVAAHLHQRKLATVTRTFRPSRIADSRTQSRVRDFISEAVYGDARSTANADEEVGDEFFAPDSQDHRRGFVKLSVSAASDRVKKLGRKVRRDSPHSEHSALPPDSRGPPKRTSTATPLVVVQEEGDHELTPEAIEALATAEPPPVPSPVYSHLSLDESPVNSSEDSFSDGSFTGTEASLPPTPAGAQLALPLLPTHHHHPPSARPRPRSRTSSSTASSVLDTPALSRPPSHTLVLDEALPKARRRDSRSDFTPGRRLNLGNIRPKDLQRILARRRRKIGRGDEEVERELDEALEEALRKAGAVDADEEQEKYEYDVLWENQRGLVVFGFPRFSSAALAQFDPSPWTDAAFKDSPYTPYTHPLENPFWEWDHTTWLVDMSLDCDECGWQYAYRFRSRYWRGEANGWRSFVRRRRWIRGRFYRPKPLLIPSKTGDGSKEIDWEALSSGDFAEGRTPDDGPAVDGPIVGMKAATAILPLSPEHKDDVFGWERAFDAQDPFLSWSIVRHAGSQALKERQASAGSRSDEELIGVWRDAVVEINYRRAAKIVKHCRLDRERLGVWYWWLGEDATRLPELADAPNAERVGTGSAYEAGAKVEYGFDPRDWKTDGRHPEQEDVWDLVEGRLDEILHMFEFQRTRLDFLRLVLSLHPVGHAHHRYHSFDRGFPHEPEALSPSLGGTRLEFYRDVQELEAFYEGRGEKKEEKPKGNAFSMVAALKWRALAKGKGKA